MKKIAITVAVTLVLLMATPIVIIELRKAKVRNAANELAKLVPKDWRVQKPNGELRAESPCDRSACQLATVVYVISNGLDPVNRGKMAKAMAESRGWAIREFHDTGEIEAKKNGLFLSIDFSDADGQDRLVSRARIGVSNNDDYHRWGG